MYLHDLDDVIAHLEHPINKSLAQLVYTGEDYPLEKLIEDLKRIKQQYKTDLDELYDELREAQEFG